MGFYPFILSMINRPEIQGALQGSEGPFYLQKLLVSQSNVFRGEGVVTVGEDIRAFEISFIISII